MKPDNGLHLRALVDIDADESGVARKAGDEWLLKGPATYIPRPDVVRRCEYMATNARLVCLFISVTRMVN